MACINMICNSLLVQLVKYDVYTTRKIKFIHAIIHHILLFYGLQIRQIRFRPGTSLGELTTLPQII